MASHLSSRSVGAAPADAGPSSRTAADRLRARLLWYDWLWLPIVAVWTVWRLAARPGRLVGTRQRLGLVPRRPPGAGFAAWIHAVSVGELVSARPIIAELKRRRPDSWVLLSVTQAHAVALARADPGGADAVCELPFDFRPCVETALARARPDVLALVECELWPGLIAAAAARGTRVVMVNARLYPRDFPNYRRARSLFAPLLGLVERIAAQSAADAERFCRLGAPADRVVPAGNSKFDVPSAVESGRQTRRSAAPLPPRTGPLVVLASTHAGEEEQLLDALAPLRSRRAGLQVLAAPRHVERAAAIVSAATARGLRACLRTQPPPDGPPVDLVVLDTMGELPEVLAQADVVFVGGSLVPCGGHNVIEPARAARPVIVGPHTENFAEVVAAFAADESILIVDSARQAVERIDELLSDARRRVDLGRRARLTVERNGGAAARAAAWILDPGLGNRPADPPAADTLPAATQPD